MSFLGIDTSNYTTSVALFDGEHGCNCSKLLEVKPGTLGLRQSDALFAHVRQLPELFARLMREMPGKELRAIGVSTRPRNVEGSYMPCFLSGQSQAEVLAEVLAVPLHRFSHQQGHIAASLWSAGRMDLMDRKHLAWHLSGGTTELLLVEPEGAAVRAEKIGGTTDISAGQLIDRTGKMLDLPFPSGKAIDALSRRADGEEFFCVKCNDLQFSLSGVQNKVQAYFDSGVGPEKTAAYALRSVIEAVFKTTKEAQKRYLGLPVVFSGGVASNSMLRELVQGCDAVFCPPEYATDNAMGIAVLAWRQEALNGTIDL